MGSAKVASLNVRPLQVSHLCFETDGILGQSTAQLGATVTAFDFAGFYAVLGSMPTAAGDPSRLLYDFLQIQSVVGPSTLASLRAEPRKAALDKAISARQNAYFAKYGNAPAIISLMNDFYSPAVIDSKPNRLAILSALADDQANELKAAYTSDNRTGVVKTTNSALQSTTETAGYTSETGSSTQSGSITEYGQSNDESIGIPDVSGTINPPPAGGGTIPWSVNEAVNVDLDYGTSKETSTSNGSSTSNDRSTSYGSAQELQTIVNTDYGYRIPYLESQAQNQRAQISLIDQQFAQFMYGQNLPNLATVFQNELTSIDADVYRLQIAYLNTILMSPIAGTVTGLYKNPGDPVRAGEPVFRVENSSVILLMAKLIYPGRISIGSSVTVETPLFEQPGPLTSITGDVVAVRGEREDNQWEVIVSCDNLDASANPIFPLGYHFDYDDTTVTIT
jgi:biotin carboxyl carrier protein